MHPTLQILIAATCVSALGFMALAATGNLPGGSEPRPVTLVEREPTAAEAADAAVEAVTRELFRSGACTQNLDGSVSCR